MSRCNCGHLSRTVQGPPSTAVPKVSSGMRLLYIGAAPKVYGGRVSGRSYSVSEHLRVFAAHAADIPELLRHFDIVEAP